jgi:tRNA(adenine34) deaminase
VTVGDRAFMARALDLAAAALERGEFPVGCIVVHRDRVLVSGSRRGTSAGTRNETDHAEMSALRELDRLGYFDSREEMTLYCTLEPCLMCFAAILLGRIGRLVFAYEDAMGGGVGIDRKALSPLYRGAEIQVSGGVCRDESIRLFKRFFLRPENGYWKGSLLERYTLDQ